MDIYWEEETHSLGGETVTYHYGYVIMQGSDGGSYDNNGSVLSSQKFLYANKVIILNEDVVWRSVYGWFDSGWHFIMMQPPQTNFRSFGFKVPGRPQYIFNQGGSWAACEEKPISSYSHVTRNDNVESPGSSYTANIVVTKDEVVVPKVHGWTALSPGSQYPWRELRFKGVAMDTAETHPDFGPVTDGRVAAPGSRYS